ncbi:MAG TPA: DUF1573 domain-containing protein [Prolixibacteraceae bacterium]|nr:DUF1573 domain-containing protein [Prolixibacteraceae bacterium]
MKKTLLSFFLLTFVAANLFAQDGKTAKADSILFDKVIHDYGPIVQGGDRTCEFTFTNKGSVPVVLSNVRASCGCTVPEWTREPVLAGQKGTIKVKYNTQIVGSFNKVVTVISNAANGNVMLTIKGNVTPKQ